MRLRVVRDRREVNETASAAEVIGERPTGIDGTCLKVDRSPGYLGEDGWEVNVAIVGR